MKPGDTVLWGGETWVVQSIVGDRVNLDRDIGIVPSVMRRRPDVPADEVELVEEGDLDIVCMGTNYRWGCYLQECECNVRCGMCPGERIKPGVWRCTCGEPFGGAA